MEIALNNNAGINNNKVEFNYSNQRSTVWDCCINFTNKMFEYRQWKFSIENRDNVIEPLYHLVRKHALTIQPKTKDFIDNIFKLYEKSDVKISMATLRVIEYMDDELLEALYNIQTFKLCNENQYSLALYTEYAKTYQTLLLHNLANTHIGGNISQAISRQSKAVPHVVLEIIELIQLTEC